MSSAANGYQWYLNGAPVAGANQQSLVPQSSGNYIVLEVFGMMVAPPYRKPFLLDLTGTSGTGGYQRLDDGLPQPNNRRLQLEMNNHIRGVNGGGA